MTIRTTNARLAQIAGKAFVLGALLVTAAGCVSASNGRYGHNDSYAAPAGSTVVAPPGSTVVIQNNAATTRQVPDYDNKWDYGRIGNGNYHGTQDDDVHNY